jgi:FKBP-type peptidyl-prolyl cis-trans isomerase
VTNLSFLSTTRSRAIPTLGALATAVLIAGCGSSGSSSTITVGNENTSDNALIKAGASATEKAPEKAPETTPTAKTPVSGPLSKAPTVAPQSGPAPTKLVVKDIIKGTGKEVTSPTQSVTVNYLGVLFHGGTEFDSSWKRKEPATFSLQGVIPGWTQGIPGMRVGGRRELIIPAALAYGAKGQGSIPPNAPLVFVIDLLGT